MTFLSDLLDEATTVSITVHAPNVGGTYELLQTVSGGSANPCRVVGGAGYAESHSGTAWVRNLVAPASPNYYNEIELSRSAFSGANGVGIRIQSSGTYYRAQLSEYGPALQLVRCNSFSSVVLTTWAWSPTNGTHTLRISAQNDANGDVVLKVLFNGVERINFTDTDPLKITTAGNPGFFLDGMKLLSANAALIAPPVVTTHPVNQTVLEPTAASFSIVASGATSYQWQVSTNGGGTWLDIASATAASYTTDATNAVADNGKLFRCGATNVFGTTYSNSASLSVSVPDTAPPTLTGTIAVSGLTSSGYTITSPIASDNVGVTGYQYRLNGGSWVTISAGGRAATVSGRAASTTDTVDMRAFDSSGNNSAHISTSIDLPAPSDVTLPVLTGSISVTDLGYSSYTLTWPAGSDNVAVDNYQVSINGGSSWIDVGNVLTYAVSGRTAGETDQVRVRARDAAGNASTPALSTAVTLLIVTISSEPLKDNTGLLQSNKSLNHVSIYNPNNGALVTRRTGLVTDSSGVVTFSDSALLPATDYAWDWETVDGKRRMPRKATA